MNDSRRQSSFHQNLHEHVVAQNGHVGWFPHSHIAHQNRSTGQVASDGSEIKRAHAQHKSLQRPVLQVIPGVGGVFGGLLGVNVLGKGAIETPEISQFGCGINLSLPGILSLAQNCRRQHPKSFLL